MMRARRTNISPRGGQHARPMKLRLSKKLTDGLRKVASVAVAAALVCGVCVPCAALAAEGGGSDTVTVTVNFVYETNSAMVAKPYVAQIAPGDSFVKDVSAPAVINYSIPTSLAEGLNDNIAFEPEGDGSGSSIENAGGTVHFALASVSSDVTVTLFYRAGIAEYTVNHYVQNVTGSNYSLLRQETLEGAIDTYTTARADALTGFVCNGVQKVPIAADDTTEVNIYYDRQMFTVAFDVNGGVNGPDPLYARYGTQYSVGDLAVPSRAGYTFAGWNPVPSGEVTEDVTYKAQWTPNTGSANYTVVFWGQNANDNEYSYLESKPTAGVVDSEVTWNPNDYICGLEEHTHSESAGCYTLVCGKTEHTHTDACVQCTHQHTAACYGSTMQETPQSVGIHSQSSILQNLTSLSGGSLQSGYIYYYGGGVLGDHYYLYLNGTWYRSASSHCGDRVATQGGGLTIRYSYYYANIDSCTHTQHDASCYVCGKEEHVHTDACKSFTCTKTEHHHTSSCATMGSLAPDPALWTFKSSDTVTVLADGSTVLNVYFDRTKPTLTFKNGSTTVGTITERWGSDISSQYTSICSSSGVIAWHPSNAASSSYFTNFVGIMPQENITYTKYNMTPGNQTMTYYGEDLDGNYQVMFTLKANFGSATVTNEDRYEFEGFTINSSLSTRNGSPMSGAKFYYDRNSYDLDFYSTSASTADKTESVLFGENLESYYYSNPPRPTTVESDAVLLGWYQSPECSGAAFDFSSHTMPANNLSLFAAWVAGLYTVETYTDDSLTSLYTYAGYNGRQENIVKYTLAADVTPPQQSGKVFAGWFYEDANGNETPFSFTEPITKNYQLYPKFTDSVVVDYTVHYYKTGTTVKVADDEERSELIGRTVTERAKVNTDLNLVPAADQNRYFPNITSTSVVLTEADMEITFYYSQAQNVPYTVKYVDENNVDLLPPVQKTTDYAVVTETYQPVSGYVARQYQITKDMAIGEGVENVIVFVYDRNGTSLTITNQGCDSQDEPQTFLYTVTDAEGGMITVAITGNGSVTLTDIPEGAAAVIQKTSWSWRYTPDSSSKTVTLDSDPSQNSVTFTNTRTSSSWLSGGAAEKNVFDPVNGLEASE